MSKKVTINDGKKVEGECLPITEIKKHIKRKVNDKKIFRLIFFIKINMRESVESGSNKALIKKLSM